MNVPDDIKQLIAAMNAGHTVRVQPTAEGQSAQRACLAALKAYTKTLRGRFRVEWIGDRAYVSRM